MNLTQQFHLPDTDGLHTACDRLTTLVEYHANRLLDNEYWSDHHLEAIGDHAGQSYTYLRDRDMDHFENADAYLYSRFKRCVYHCVAHILDAHTDEYDAFRFVLDTVEDGPIRGVGWSRLRHELFENPESPYVNWGVLEQVVEQLNDYYDTHGRFPDVYSNLVACPNPNGTLAYAPDKGDHHIYDLAVEEGEVVVTLNAPDTLDPASYHDWSDHEVRVSTPARFHDLLDAGDSVGAPTLHASEDGDGYILDVPVDIPESPVESTNDRVLAADLGVKKQATCAPVEPDERGEGSFEQVAPPEFIDHPSKSKLLRLKADAEGINDRLGELRRAGKAHTARFDHLLAEYRHTRRKERRLRKQVQHDVANELVWLAIEHGCSKIVFESLAGLEGTSGGVTAWSISSWARGDLLEKVEYRAKLLGVSVETVNPWGTSRYCPRCGSRGETVRAPNDHEELRHGGHFHCPDCGYEADRDYVGAVNVGRKYLGEGMMEEANPVAYTATGAHASFPSCTLAEGVRARSAGVRSATGTGIASGRQTQRPYRRAVHEGDEADTSGPSVNQSRNTGWRCPKPSVTRYALARTVSNGMLPNPTEN